jgi:hypothetical protein
MQCLLYWASTEPIKARTESLLLNLYPGVPQYTRYPRATSGFSSGVIPVVDRMSQKCEDFSEYRIKHTVTGTETDEPSCCKLRM